MIYYLKKETGKTYFKNSFSPNCAFRKHILQNIIHLETSFSIVLFWHQSEVETLQEVLESEPKTPK